MNDEARATALIDSGASLREVTRCFTRSLDGYQYFAQVMQDRFSVDQAGTAPGCVLCKSGSDHSARQITWRAIAHDKSTGSVAIIFLLLGGLTSQRVEVRFATAHQFCAKCATGLWWRFSMIRLAKTGLFALLLIGLFVTVPLIVISGVVAFMAPDLVLKFGAILLAALVFDFLVYLGLRWAWVSAIPTGLRFISRYPFEPLEIQRS